jgi:MscS family membrane protein
MQLPYPERRRKFWRFFKRLFLLSFLLFIFEVPSILDKYFAIEVPSGFKSISGIIQTLLIALIAVTFIKRLTEKRIFRVLGSEVEIEEVLLLGKMYSFFLFSMALAVTFWRAGVSLENLTIFLGLITTGIAFAIRDILLSLVTWYILLVKKPFRIGEFITIGDEKGEVERIGTFFVTIKDPVTGDGIKIPNNALLTKNFVNSGKGRMPHLVKIPLVMFPNDANGFLGEIGENVQQNFPGIQSLSVNLNYEAEHWFLFIRFFSDPNLRGVANQVTYHVVSRYVNRVKINSKA